jgi:hypothetical protein
MSVLRTQKDERRVLTIVCQTPSWVNVEVIVSEKRARESVEGIKKLTASVDG